MSSVRSLPVVDPASPAPAGPRPEPALVAEGLTVAYGDRTVVRDVDLTVGAGEIVGLIGESGSGKSTIGLAAARLLPRSARVAADALAAGGHDLLALGERQMRRVRGADIGMVFQDPLSALNPCMRVGDQIGEVIRIHEKASRRAARARAVDLLRAVEVPDPVGRARQFPLEMSGGMRQRIVIAIATALSPRLLVADEPTTALDTTVQAQILRLLGRLRDEMGMGILLVSHDLAVIAEVCSRVVVLYDGEVVEEGPIDRVLRDPQHPYTRLLLDASPSLDREAKAAPAPAAPAGLAPGPGACRFLARCPRAAAGCDEPQVLVGDGVTAVRCHRAVAP